MNGDNKIDLFESDWTHWNLNDSLKWFKYVLTINNNNNNDDCSSDSESESDSNNGLDDEKIEEIIILNDEIDYSKIESMLQMMKFRAKKNFPLIQTSYQLKQFGFKNKKDCKLLSKQTKLLLKKYPKKKSKKHKQQKKKGDSLGRFLEDYYTMISSSV